MAERHIRSLVLKDKNGRERGLETDLFNYEIERQFKGWKMDRERDLRASKGEDEAHDED